MKADRSKGRTIGCACTSEPDGGIDPCRRTGPWVARDALDPLRPHGRNARTEGPTADQGGEPVKAQRAIAGRQILAS